MLTCRSPMASRSADWTLAGARLISSASTRLAKTGPSSVSKVSVEGRHTRVPTMSPGIRSGVNCRRWKLPPVTSARVRTASVLATPGTPSSSRCPRASRAISIRSTIASCPTSTRLTSKRARSSRAALRSVVAASISAVGSWASGISGGWLSEVVMGRSSDSLVADLNSAPERQNGGRVCRSWDAVRTTRTRARRSPPTARRRRRGSRRPGAGGRPRTGSSPSTARSRRAGPARARPRPG